MGFVGITIPICDSLGRAGGSGRERVRVRKVHSGDVTHLLGDSFICLLSLPLPLFHPQGSYSSVKQCAVIRMGFLCSCSRVQFKGVEVGKSGALMGTYGIRAERPGHIFDVSLGKWGFPLCVIPIVRGVEEI